MNVLLVFPKYQYLALVEDSARNRFLNTCEKFVESCERGRHKLYLIAENDTARMLKEDLPYSRYITLTRSKDKELVEVCSSLSDCSYTDEECVGADYSISTDTAKSVITSIEEFEKYYIDYLKMAYEALKQDMNVIVEFSMAKKYMRFSLKEVPKACIYYRYNIQTSKGELYMAGLPAAESLTETWRGGIPSA